MTIPRSTLLIAALFASSLSGQSLEVGKKAYESRCVGCHGSDGAGGGHGPNVVDVRRPRATTKEALRALILKGIPEAGMPPFPMPDAELDAIVAYFGTLKSPAAENPVHGDAAEGERFFTGNGKCSSCHMVRGRGGILGPDLSNLARERKLGQIEQALKDSWCGKSR
jgi:cytochrome c oxidase cbb3-type subunit 3